MKSTKITVLLGGIVFVSLVTGLVFLGGNNHSMSGSHNSILKFNAKPVAYTPEETADHDATAGHEENITTEETTNQEEALDQTGDLGPQETSNETDNIQDQKSSNSNDASKVKKEEIPTFEGLKNIEFVKYTVKANDTLWKIVKANMPNYKSYPVGGIEGVVSYIGEKNNLKKDSNDSYIVYSGLKITIPREKNISAKVGSSNTTSDNASVAVKNTLSVVKKTDTASKTSTSNSNTANSSKSTVTNSASNNQTSTASSISKTETGSSRKENTDSSGTNADMSTSEHSNH